jgi:hypothetical protein
MVPDGSACRRIATKETPTMKTTGRILQGAVTLALVTVLAAPAGALAAPGLGMSGQGPGARGAAAAQGNRLGAPKPSNDASGQALRGQPLVLLRQRIEMVLQIRKARFDFAVARLTARITRVSGFADVVEKAGGDVSAVRARLAEASSLLDRAKSEEAAAIELFKAVPAATDRQAAFKAARAQAKTAQATLQSARQALRTAILDLRAIVNGLKGAGQ